MKLVSATVFSFLFTVSCADFLRKEEESNPQSVCRCSTFISPLPEGNAPQLVSLIFVEDVVSVEFENFWQPLFFERKNPDGKPISGTFFVSHQYTDYKCVQDLYVQGFEIGINPITYVSKNTSSQYWDNATQDARVQELQAERIITSTFAKIPEDDLIGVRPLQLQPPPGDTINTYVESGFQYESSCSLRSKELCFPYIVDYLPTQECRPGTICSPSAFWILPIINLQDNNSNDCINIFSCGIEGTADEISDWLLKQLNRVRFANKAPLTLIVSSAWFRSTENSYAAFEKFLDAVSGFNDVFLVSLKQVVDWMKTPVPVEQFQTEASNRTSDCLDVTCSVLTANGYTYVRSCVPCPEVYPWVGNPLGEAN